MPHRIKRILLPLLFLSYAHHPATAQSIPEQPKVNHSWFATALKLQRELDFNTPLNEATFIGTHNSYNSTNYSIPGVRYLDPNQSLSLYEQLEMGVRSIEFDAHWTLTNHATTAILLCHGQSNHVGCTLYDRPFTEGLQELHDWLLANPKEIILLYIKRYVDGHEPRLASELDNYLGEFIFKTNAYRNKGEDPRSCVALPGTLTKADILQTGKQVVIVTKDCASPYAHYEEQDKFKQQWNDFAFAGIGDIPTHPNTFIDATITGFTAYPDCGKSIFNSDMHHTSLWRIYEDRSVLGNLGHKEKALLDNDMRDLTWCGINWPTIDMLTSSDTRVFAAIWSWAPNYPSNKGQCAFYKKDEGIENTACDQSKGGFVCKEENTHEIKVAAFLGPWSNGEATCQLFAGKTWHFAVPVNGVQMRLVKELMTPALLQEVWLNYSADKDGHWIANKINKY